MTFSKMLSRIMCSVFFICSYNMLFIKESSGNESGKVSQMKISSFCNCPPENLEIVIGPNYTTAVPISADKVAYFNPPIPEGTLVLVMPTSKPCHNVCNRKGNCYCAPNCYAGSYIYPAHQNEIIPMVCQ